MKSRVIFEVTVIYNLFPFALKQPFISFYEKVFIKNFQNR